MSLSFKDRIRRHLWLEDRYYKRAMKIAFYLLKPRFRSIYGRYLFKRGQTLDALASRAPLTRNLYFEVTNRCNAACSFCPYPDMERDKLVMPMDLFRNIIDQYVMLGGRSVGFTPIVGDPMLDKFLFDRIDYIDPISQIANIGFYTNGIALTAKKADRFMEPRATTINLSISFGGYDRETYHKVMGVDRYDAVARNVQYLLDRLREGKPDNLNVKIDYRFPEHISDQPLSFALTRAKDDGLIRTDTLNGTFDTFGGRIDQEKLDRAESDFTLSYGIPKVGPCEILFWKPLILADGRVNACAERDLETTLIIGDLKQESLKDILYGQKMMALVNRFYHRDQIPPVCKACTVYNTIHDSKSKIWKNDLNWAP